jgi:hypothetical protein
MALLNLYIERAKQYQLKHEALAGLVAQMS